MVGRLTVASKKNDFESWTQICSEYRNIHPCSAIATHGELCEHGLNSRYPPYSRFEVVEVKEVSDV